MTPDALYRATEIQRRYEPRDWPAAIQREPAEFRETCTEYLRGIAARMRTQRACASRVTRAFDTGKVRT